MSPEQSFADLLAAAPSQPFVTYYDEARTERTELSVRSLANWVAKTHFLLVDELGLGVGDAALIDLPAHWISVPCVLGALTAGLALTSDPSAAAVAFVASADHAGDVPEVYTVAPDDGNYVTAVRPQADAWAGVRFGAGRSDQCVDGRDRAQVVSLAVERAASLGVARGARVLTTRNWSGPDDWIDTLFVPLVMGGSVVYVRNAPSADVVARRMTQERATVRV